MDEEIKVLKFESDKVHKVYMEAILRTENLKVIYGMGQSHETRALDGVDVSIYPEEYVVLFGPSGSGKSTLLYGLLGIERPTSGKIYVKGKEVNQLDARGKIKLRQSTMGIIFQAYHLIPSLSVIENVSLPLVFSGRPDIDRQKKGRSLLERFGIKEQAHKLPSQLSGGQQQRAAVARALVNDPEILMADEPVGNLDSKSAESVMLMLKEINERDKKTVILVTHDANLLKYAHRVYYMKDGKIEKVSTIREAKRITHGVLKEKEPAHEKQKVRGLAERFKELFPNASLGVLRSRALTRHFSCDLSFEQTDRMEAAISRFMEGNLSDHELYSLLDTPIRDGGVGLNEPKARSYASRIKEFVAEAKRDARGQGLSHARQYIFKDYGGYLSSQQKAVIETLIRERMDGRIDLEGFKSKLDAPIQEGGVGLNARSVQKISDNLEVMLVARN